MSNRQCPSPPAFAKATARQAVARASTEQQTAIEALGSRVKRSSDLGVKNSEAIAGMGQTADEVRAQAASLGELVGQYQTDASLGCGKKGKDATQALEDPGAFALSS